MHNLLETIQLLRDTRDLLATPESWCQKSFAVDVKGKGSPAVGKQAQAYCLSGTLQKAWYHRGMVGLFDAKTILNQVIGQDNIPQWNDSPTRTYQDVISSLNVAIAIACFKIHAE